MTHEHQLNDRPHFTDLPHETVWVDDEHSRLDADHAQALSRLGFGFSSRRSSELAH